MEGTGKLIFGLVAAPTPAPAPVRRDASTKRGLAYNSDQSSAAKLFTSKQISWGYNWGSTRESDDLPSNVEEYVPMCWGDTKVANCESGLASSVASGAQHILGFFLLYQCGSSCAYQLCSMLTLNLQFQRA